MVLLRGREVWKMFLNKSAIFFFWKHAKDLFHHHEQEVDKFQEIKIVQHWNFAGPIFQDNNALTEIITGVSTCLDCS